MPRTTRNQAFTLIELLVVIAIIAILAAILFPVFAQAKEAAKKTQDLSNVKNISLGVTMYGTDNEDMYPRQVYKRVGAAVWGWNTPFTWREASMPYIKNGQQEYNDGTNQVRLAQGGIWDTPAKPGARYAYNSNRNLMPGMCYWWGGSRQQWVCDQNDDGTIGAGNVSPMPSVSMTALDAPAQTASKWTIGVHPEWNSAGDFAEASWWWFGGENWPPQFTGPNSGQKWDADSTVFPHWSMPRYRYTQGLNLGFADGHAKFVKKGAFNWCQYVYVKGHESDRDESWAWLFDPGSYCSAFAR